MAIGNMICNCTPLPAPLGIEPTDPVTTAGVAPAGGTRPDFIEIPKVWPLEKLNIR